MIDVTSIILNMSTKGDFKVVELGADKVPTRQEQIESQVELGAMIAENAAARLRSSLK